MRKWCPPAVGPLKRRVGNAVRDIAAHIGGEIASSLPKFALSDSSQKQFRMSLANGMGGLAIFYTVLYREYRDAYYRGLSLQCIDAAIDAVTRVPSASDLYGGFLGVAWASLFLKRNGIFVIDDREYQQIDRALFGHLAVDRKRLNYDVMSGIVGSGLYGLARSPSKGGAVCVKLVIDRLHAHALKKNESIVWSAYRGISNSDPEGDKSEFRYNLGMAHGIPCIIAFMAKAAGKGYKSDVLSEMIHRSIRWLLLQELEPHQESLFPAYIEGHMEPRASRLSWCYGDLCVSICLLQAAVHSDVLAWRVKALEIAGRTIARGKVSSGVKGPAFCHGAAGIMHQYNRIFNATGEDKYRYACLKWLEYTLEFKGSQSDLAGFKMTNQADRSGHLWTGDLGLLNGLAGIGLALLATVSRREPTWDELFLLDVPPL